MTGHDHDVITPGCFRCALNEDEIACHGCVHCPSHAPDVDEDCWVCLDCDESEEAS